jgi:hypothetical protein
MRIYLAMVPNFVLPLPRAGLPKTRTLRLLFSFADFKRENVGHYITRLRELGFTVDLFADSGAYTAYTCGDRLDPGEYIEWVRKWEPFFAIAAGPDVIGDADATTRETERMLASGLSLPILPTVHVGDDLALLDYWCRKSSYIALGGMVRFIRRQRPMLTGWCRAAFERVPSTVRVHGFGMTLPSIVRGFPWYSVDSSFWATGNRWGAISLFEDKSGRFVRMERRKPATLLKSIALLESYQLRPAMFKTFDSHTISRAAMEAWQRFEDWLNRRGGGDGVQDVPTGDGCAREAQARRLQPPRDVGG